MSVPGIDVSGAAPKPEECGQCGRPRAWINGRTLGYSANPKQLTGKTPDVNKKKWVCPKCHAHLLRTAKDNIPLPFCDADGVMRTVEDDLDTPCLDFCGFLFTRNALASAQGAVNVEEAKTNSFTAEVEAKAQEYLSSPSRELALAFSDMVCTWGRGHRVWGNLDRHNNGDLATPLHEWLLGVRGGYSVEEAVTPRSEDFAGMPKGLAVSFASKHLRMLDPFRFATLDDVLCKGLGFALNPKGYALFLRMLREFAASLPDADPEKPNLAEVEAGIFGLVRQHVRSTEGFAGFGCLPT